MLDNVDDENDAALKSVSTSAPLIHNAKSLTFHFRDILLKFSVVMPV